MLEKTFGNKLVNVDYYDRRGAYGIIIKNNRLATVKTTKGNFLIGGKIENDESKQECIIRECLEEIGYQVEIEGFICKTDSFLCHEKIGYFHPVSFFYLANLKEKVEQPLAEDHDLEWIDLSEIDEKLYLNHQIWAVNQAINLL